MYEIGRYDALTIDASDEFFRAVYVAYVDGYVEVVYPTGSRRFVYEGASFRRRGGWRLSFTLRVVEGLADGTVSVTDTFYEVVDG